jgi:hypothetical protein
MAWGSDTAGGTQTDINGTTEEFSNAITLDPGELCDCQLQIYNDSSSVTDRLICSVYTTLDDSSENWDTKPVLQFEYEPNAGQTNEYYSFAVAGFYRFRLGWLSSGSTDTYDVTLNYRTDGVSAS